MVGAARRDCRVGVLRQDGSTVGFFPFHVGRARVARPIGRKLADYQGAIVDPAVEWGPEDLVRVCGLRGYSFDHLLGAQTQFRPFFDRVAPSPILDFTVGSEGHPHAPDQPPPHGPSEARRKWRRIDRRWGLRFELHEPDRRSLKTLVRWKSEQYRRTGQFDALSRPWVVEVLERAHATQTKDLAGVLSCLYADETLVAAHFGLRSGPVLHSWFPAYDVGFAKYSPGLMLLLAITEAAAADGVQIFDFGKGAEEYKSLFANRSIEVGTGSIEIGRASAVAARLARAMWSIPLRSPLYRHVHRLRRRLEMG
jgi:CelD/BcsL family acetyltransferase involved in cellulose biosynthesis